MDGGTLEASLRDNYEEISIEAMEQKYSNFSRSQLILEIRILKTENKSLRSDVNRLMDLLVVYKEMPSVEAQIKIILKNLKTASDMSENLAKNSQKDTSKESSPTVESPRNKRKLDTGVNNVDPKRRIVDVNVKEEHEEDPLQMENSGEIYQEFDSSGYMDQSYWTNSYQGGNDTSSSVMVPQDSSRTSYTAPGTENTPKYTCLSLDDKIKIIHDYQAGARNKDLAKKYRVTHATITKIIQNSEKYLQELTKQTNVQGNLKRTRVTGVIDSPFEKAIYYWFVQKRHLGEPVMGTTLREKALQLHVKMNGETEFQASEGWLAGFKRRHGIRSLSMKGEVFSIKAVDAKEFCVWFRSVLKEQKYSLDNVFNADETGMFWKTVPEKILFVQDDTEASSNVDKSRVTLLACANASGTMRMPLLLIGKSKNPPSFQDKKLPLEYESQPNAWMDGDVFIRWYKNVFLPGVKKAKPGPDERFLLLLDNAPSHPPLEELNSIDPQCKIIYLPLNVTSIVQPMEQGPISALKRAYKTQFLRELLAHKLCDTAGAQEFVKNWSLYDCCNFLADCWNSLPVSTLKQSWDKIFPDQSASGDEDLSVLSEEAIFDVANIANELSDGHRFSTAEIEDWIEDKDAVPFRTLSDTEICQKFIEGETKPAEGVKEEILDDK